MTPAKMGKPMLDQYRAFILERISPIPHLLKDELAARGILVSHNAVWIFLRREGSHPTNNYFLSAGYASVKT